MLHKHVLYAALGLSLATAAAHAAPTHVTIYRSQADHLFQNSASEPQDSGYAVIRDQRQLDLEAGRHSYHLDQLPRFIDGEAIHFDLGDAQLIAQQLVTPASTYTTLQQQLGHDVRVLDRAGKELASGKLLQLGANASLTVNDNKQGILILRDYATVQLSKLALQPLTQLTIDAKAEKAHSTEFALTYPAAGLAWRAAYTGQLDEADGCTLTLSAMANIANRSGIDLDQVSLDLVAGQPQFDTAQAPQFMLRAMAADSAQKSAPMPEQSDLADYHQYHLPEPLTLNQNSITSAPLYAAHAVSCQREWLLTLPQRGMTSKPNVSKQSGSEQTFPIDSKLEFKTFDNFPAGRLRILTDDKNGHAQFIGGNRLDDTAQDKTVTVALGKAFDLDAKHARVDFDLDKSARTLEEAFTVTLHNRSAHARTITVRDHAWRWHQWELLESNVPVSKQTENTLEFEVEVPANTDQELTYRIGYSWQAADE